MDELAKAFQRFIARDLIFIVAGGTVITAFLYNFGAGRIPSSNDHIALYLLLAGVAYVVGYAIQDGLSLTALLTTASVQTPSPFVRWLYRRFTRTEWVDIANIDLAQAQQRIPDGEPRVQHERIITLKQVGTAAGPSFALSGLLFLLKFLLKWRTDTEAFDLAVGLAGGVFGIVLVCLGWVKGAQQAQFESRYRTDEPAAQHANGADAAGAL
jgi:hypothetical protein